MTQDYVIAFVQWSMAVALLPTLLHADNKPTFLSSTWTASLLIVLAITFATLDLWGSVASSLTVSALWFAIAYQRYRINKKAGKPLVEVPYWLARLASIIPFF